MNAGRQVLEAAVGKIGAADAAVKQHVAAENDPRPGTPPDVNDMARRMARDLQHFQLEPGGAIDFALVEQHVSRRADQRQAVLAERFNSGIGQLGGVAAADDQRNLGPTPLQRRVAADVVAVAVRDHQQRPAPSLAVDMFENQLGLKARIENQAVVPSLEMGDIGVFAKRGRNNRGQT